MKKGTFAIQKLWQTLQFIVGLDTCGIETCYPLCNNLSLYLRMNELVAVAALQPAILTIRDSILKILSICVQVGDIFTC
jgi:hypothetical protein